jgi:FkbM family methyltransferase
VNEQFRKVLRFGYRGMMFLLRLIRQFILVVVAGLIRMLPEQFRLDLRDRCALVRKADYKKPYYIHVDSQMERDLRLHEASKEPETVEWIENTFRKGDIFYDIGANVGSFSLIAFRAFAAEIGVYAFEPSIMNFPQLSRNIHLNGADEHIFPFQVALSDRTGTTTFHYHNLDSGGAMHALDEPINWRGDPFQPVRSAPTISYRLDDFITQFELPVPNHIKIDVDGPEFKILQGAEDTLKSSQMRSLMIETFDEGEDFSAIEKIFKDCGFTLQTKFAANYLYAKD